MLEISLRTLVVAAHNDAKRPRLENTCARLAERTRNCTTGLPIPPGMHNCAIFE